MNKFKVSFNSPQCGWMSVGFSGNGSEFHTTTAHAPHDEALSEILRGLTSLLQNQIAKDAFVIAWSRNPEAYDFVFNRNGANILFEVTEFPTFSRIPNESEKVFEYSGDVVQFCAAFHETFVHLKEDIDTDVFEQNWHQPFPFQEFEEFEKALKNN